MTMVVGVVFESAIAAVTAMSRRDAAVFTKCSLYTLTWSIHTVHFIVTKRANIVFGATTSRIPLAAARPRCSSMTDGLQLFMTRGFSLRQRDARVAGPVPPRRPPSPPLPSQ